jgi:hypothetical protein
MPRPDGHPGKPGAPGYRISTLTAFIAVDPKDDSEGIVAFTNVETGASEPLIGADDARIMQLRPMAEASATVLGIEVRLVRFTVRENIDTINPKTKEQ